MLIRRVHPHVVGLGGTLRPHSTSTRALERALAGAEEAGARVTLFDLEALGLPLYRPGLPLEGFGPGAVRLIEAVREADAMIWSTSAYHGTLSGATKNALDFFEFMARDAAPYLHGRPVGLIATAAGDMAAVNAVNAMVHVAHALRATVSPLSVAIPQASQVFGDGGAEVDPHWAARLGTLGELVVGMARGGGGRAAEEVVALSAGGARR